MIGQRERKFLIMLLAAAVIGCATPDSGTRTPPLTTTFHGRRPVFAPELSIHLWRGVSGSDNRPSLFVRIGNTSRDAVCLPLDMVRDPYSESVYIEFRGKNGASLVRRTGGFHEGPRPGIVTLRPGEAVTPRFYLDNYFVMPPGGLGSGQIYEARIRFLYSICGRPRELTGVGGWQDIL